MNDTTLNGLARPAWGLPRIVQPVTTWPDHTYVTFDVDLGTSGAWSCHGGTNGGRLLLGSSGRAVQQIAECLANPNGTAGVRYRVDGVCHQSANRILYAIGNYAKVDACYGYRVSEWWFGPYGRNVVEWVRRKQRCMPSGVMVGAADEPSSDEPGDNDIDDRLRRIDELYDDITRQSDSGPQDSLSPTADEVNMDAFREETRITLEIFLGEGFNKRTRDRVTDSRVTAIIRDGHLVKTWKSQEISAKRCAKRGNKLLFEHLQEVAAIMGIGPFRHLFDVGPEERVDVIDLDTIEQILE